METDAESLLDQTRDPRASPKFGIETELAWRTLQPAEHLAFLVAIEPGLWPAMGFGRKGLFPFLSSRRDPTADSSIGNSQHPSHLGDAGAFLDSLDGALPPPFEFDSASVRSHANKRTENENAG